MRDCLFWGKLMATGNLQFERSSFLTIGPLTADEGVKFQNLRMSFNFTKTSDRKNNNGTIKIWNLRPKAISEITKGDIATGVTFEAGYKGREAVIFVGTVVGVFIEYDNVDSVLNISVADGAIGTAQGWFTQSYKGATNPWDVIEDVALIMGEGTNLERGIFSETAVAPYKNGFVWNGLCGKALTRICDDKNLTWFIDDNKLHVIDKDVALSPVNVPFLSPNTGLIGSPVYHEEQTGSRKDKHTLRGIKFKCLLNPRIAVGNEVAVQSKLFDDHYLVKQIIITGDNEQGAWEMEVTAINERI